MKNSGLKCTVSVGEMQIKNLLANFNKKEIVRVKTTKKGMPSLDSMAKALQKESSIRSAKYAEEAKAKREAAKQKKTEEQQKAA